MTKKEKIELLIDYCNSLDGCSKCVFNDNGWCNDTVIRSWKESQLDEAIMLVNKNKKSDNVNHPEHYSGKHECIDVMVAMFGVEAVKHFCMCNSFKYRFRADRKNGEEDIKKAEWYEDKLIELGGVDGNAN